MVLGSVVMVRDIDKWTNTPPTPFLAALSIVVRVYVTISLQNVWFFRESLV
jgi:hypothetical protein